MEVTLSDNPYLDKLRSIGTPRKQGQSEVKVEEAEGAKVITTEHWSGQVDATVRPATVRRQARTHKTGHKKDTIAEVTPMPRKLQKERYGEQK